MLTPTHLTTGDVRKIEEALNTDDLETMVAVVDRIVELRLRAAMSSMRPLAPSAGRHA